jgi:acyl-CoA dehydrogenase
VNNVLVIISAWVDDPRNASEGVSLMRELATGYPLSDWQRNMLAELKTYLDKNFPSERDSVGSMTAEWYDDDDYNWYHKFNQQLAKDGWLIPHWPVEYGGNGWSQIDNMLIREEFAYRRIPLVNANGLDMLGPVLLHFGTEEQKAEYLPGIANVTTMWCQGFSEPEAGSDLTSLRTTAVRDGDEYVINGSKIWTGHAVRASWMILLARTLQGSARSGGISMILVDMENTPGISKHPIRSMSGRATFCQEFFADARVPVTNLIGEEHGGWALSRMLLEHERGGVGAAAKLRRRLDDLLDMVDERGLARPGSAVALKLGEMIEQTESARAMAYEMAEARGEGGAPPHSASVLKLLCTNLSLEMSELGVELLGLDAVDYHPEVGSWTPWEEYLYSFIGRIAGGSNQIQREIVASRLLGVGRS